MTNNIESRIYLFLAQNGGIQAADQDGGGTVIKSEFKTFMLEKFDWDGETTEAGKNDIINQFWGKIDTQTKGKISGTKFFDKNALNANEVEVLENKIATYEALDNYISAVEVPSVVEDATIWKSSINESLTNYTEKFLKEGGKAEDLAAYLDTVIEEVKLKTTTDRCIRESVETAVAELADNLGYKSTDDETLNKIINTFFTQIVNAEEIPDYETIKETANQIVEAYMALAGFGENLSGIDLADYGYNPNAKAGLNDLQQAVLTKSLNDAVNNDSKMKELYEANKELFDAAITTFLGEVKFNEFAEVNANVLAKFKESKAYKGVDAQLQVRELATSEELKKLLGNDSLGDMIIKDGMYLPTMKEILEQAVTKAANGDFNKEGEFDKDLALNWMKEQIEARVMEFYKDSYGDMSLTDMEKIYDLSAAAADKTAKTDAEKALQQHQEAAIIYCRSLAAKSDSFAKVINEICGGDFEAKFKSLERPSLIKELINNIETKVKEIGDPSTFTLSSINGAPEYLPMDNGTGKTFKLSGVVMNGDKPIDANRIAFNVTTEGGGVKIAYNKNTKEVTLTGAAAGTYTVKIAAVVDGIQIGEAKTIQVVIKPSTADILGQITGWNGASMDGVKAIRSRDDESNAKDNSFADLYNGDVIVDIFHVMNTSKSGWGHNYADILKGFTNLVNGIVSALSTVPGLDAGKLAKAGTIVIGDYMGKGSCYYENSDGTHTADLREHIVNKMNEKRDETGHRIVQMEDDDGADSNMFAVRFRDVVDDILATYWSMAA